MSPHCARHRPYLKELLGGQGVGQDHRVVPHPLPSPVRLVGLLDDGGAARTALGHGLHTVQHQPRELDPDPTPAKGGGKTNDAESERKSGRI